MLHVQGLVEQGLEDGGSEGGTVVYGEEKREDAGVQAIPAGACPHGQLISPARLPLGSPPSPLSVPPINPRRLRSSFALARARRTHTRTYC